MGNPLVTNIMKSNAAIWYAPEAEELPDTNTAAGSLWGGNWARVGYTKVPLTWAIEREDFDLVVEEELLAVDRVALNYNMMFETQLAELTADYFSLLMGGAVTTTAAGPAQVGYERLETGQDFLLTKYVIGFEGVRLVSGSELPFRVYMRRGTFTVNGSLEFSKRNTEYPGIPLQAKMLAASDPANAPLVIERVTALATS